MRFVRGVIEARPTVQQQECRALAHARAVGNQRCAVDVEVQFRVVDGQSHLNTSFVLELGLKLRSKFRRQSSADDSCETRSFGRARTEKFARDPPWQLSVADAR